MVGRLVVTDEMIKQFPSSERILPEAEYHPIIRGENILPMCSPLGDQLPLYAVAPTASSQVAIAPLANAVARAITEADLDGMSPREALAFLAELQAKLS